MLTSWSKSSPFLMKRSKLSHGGNSSGVGTKRSLRLLRPSSKNMESSECDNHRQRLSCSLPSLLLPMAMVAKSGMTCASLCFFSSTKCEIRKQRNVDLLSLCPFALQKRMMHFFYSGSSKILFIEPLGFSARSFDT